MKINGHIYSLSIADYKFTLHIVYNFLMNYNDLNLICNLLPLVLGTSPSAMSSIFAYISVHIYSVSELVLESLKIDYLSILIVIIVIILFYARSNDIFGSIPATPPIRLQYDSNLI